jgi:hypothetical protein
MKIILAIVLFGVIALGFWLLDWQKKMNDSQQLVQQIESKRQDYERIKEETRSLTTLVQQNEQLTKEYQAVVQGRFKTDKPEQPEAFVPDFITKLEILVAQVASDKADTGLELNALTPSAATTGADPNKKKDEVPSIVQTTLERFPKRKFQLTLHARYDTVIYLLDKLGNLALDRLVTVDHISLAPSGSINDVHPELAVTLPLTAYLKTSGGQ